MTCGGLWRVGPCAQEHDWRHLCFAVVWPLVFGYNLLCEGLFSVAHFGPEG